MANELMVLAEDQVYAQLRKLRLRPTSARISIVKALLESPLQAKSAERIFLELFNMGVSISLTTVYRILMELEQHRLVHREWPSPAAGSKSLFVLASSNAVSGIYAISCTVCQKTHQVTDKAFLENLQRRARAAGFELDPQQTIVSVICSQCAAKQQGRDSIPEEL